MEDGKGTPKKEGIQEEVYVSRRYNPSSGGDWVNEHQRTAASGSLYNSVVYLFSSSVDIWYIFTEFEDLNS
jgi:hypothetical protein